MSHVAQDLEMEVGATAGIVHVFENIVESHTRSHDSILRSLTKRSGVRSPEEMTGQSFEIDEALLEGLRGEGEHAALLELFAHSVHAAAIDDLKDQFIVTTQRQYEARASLRARKGLKATSKAASIGGLLLEMGEEEDTMNSKARVRGGRPFDQCERGAKGICISDKSYSRTPGSYQCAGAAALTGKCPAGASNVRCCPATSGFRSAKCDAKGGLCKLTNHCAESGGTSMSGLCPGPAGVKCCTRGQGTSAKSPPSTTTAATATTNSTTAKTATTPKPTTTTVTKGSSSSSSSSSSKQPSKQLPVAFPNKCRTCQKETAPKHGRDWKEACAAECSVVPQGTTKESIWQKAKSALVGAVHDKSQCPKFEFSWKCLHAWMPHLGILGISGNFYGVVGGVEAVTDYHTFQVGFFIYGGLSYGANWKEALGGQVYGGVGYKGEDSSKGIEEAYSEHFLSVDGGASIFLGVNGILAVSAAPVVKNVPGLDIPSYLLTYPKFSKTKTICAGVSLAAEAPTVLTGNIGSTYYKSLYTIDCVHPHCFAAALLLTPGHPLQKIVAMKIFMDRYCAPESKYKSGIICKGYQALKWAVGKINEWAKKGFDALKRAWHAGKKMVGDAVRTIQRTFNRAVEDTKKAVDKFLKDHVAEPVDSVRSWLGDTSPELKKRPVIPIPSGSGTYVKIVSCRGGSFKEPYWRCWPEDRSGMSKDSGVGLKRRDGKFWWDFNSDPTKTGYGMMFRVFAGGSWWGAPKKTPGGKCIKCHLIERHRLGHSWRMGKDEKFEGTNFRVCDGSATETKDVRVSGKGGTCAVYYHHQPE